MRSLIRSSTGCAGLLLLAACSSMSIQTEKNPKADLAKYKTYAWAPPAVSSSGQPRPSSILDQQVEAAVDSELARKGLVPAKGSPPELLLRYSAMSRNALAYGYTYDHFGPPNEYGYRQGSLRIEFIDPNTNQVVFQGTAADVISDTGASQKQIAEAVHKIINEYPPV